MADETTTTTAPEVSDTPSGPPEGFVPVEQLQKLDKDARSAKESAKHAQKQIAELQRQLEERETAGLPELDQAKKRLEAAERRAEEAERKAAETESKLIRSSRERLVTAAAREAGFADPTDASAFLDLDSIEDEKDAERAVKRLAQQKKHLLKAEGPALPGKVLENGRPTPNGVPASATASADEQWAAEVAPMLKKMVGGWSSTSS